MDRELDRELGRRRERRKKGPGSVFRRSILDVQDDEVAGPGTAGMKDLAAIDAGASVISGRGEPNANGQGAPNELADGSAGRFEFLVWQLADSAFPTGGFAHSGGLEAAWQHGAVRNRGELRSWILESLRQVGRASIPFVTAAHGSPERVADLDRECDAFTVNHVANRASRAQGKAWLAAVARIRPSISIVPPCGHLAPVFGRCLGELGVPHLLAVRLFFFHQLRSAMAAAVRLNIIGPMDGQSLQFQLAACTEEMAVSCASLRVADAAQTSPLLEIWQGTQDRLYSRLFQS